MERIRKYLPEILLISIFILTIVIWFFVFIHNKNNDYLKVVFLDVGQGDSIYIEAPNGRQMLIDGGPDAKVLSSLSKVMPFADRSLDMLIATHGDQDHIGGFPLILDNYKVASVVTNGASSESKIFSSLEERISKNKINKIVAHRGMHIILDKDKNIYLDILFPDRDASSLESNDGSIVGKLVYGKNSFMFTGDATIYTENLIGWNESENTIDSDVLKLGHHGSRTSSSILWLEMVSPDIAIVSAGKDNRYDHPHTELLERLSDLKIPYLSTSQKGNIIFKSDGVNIIY
ncbi:MAG TPA: MBL fold metallo-hydrolase [Candidatus Paceibacterota bacterium]|nr:MBL fold metallo-hydrolase [Candidatus Paceibacterota bacterium]